TINDVLFGVVSSGLSRYLDHRSPNALPEGLRITGLAMVNIRRQPGLQERAGGTNLACFCCQFIITKVELIPYLM
ncbi:hypothetical protein CISIN_1g0129801mg, partial [Citrus sinensis]